MFRSGPLQLKGGDSQTLVTSAKIVKKNLREITFLAKASAIVSSWIASIVLYMILVWEYSVIDSLFERTNSSMSPAFFLPTWANERPWPNSTLRECSATNRSVLGPDIFLSWLSPLFSYLPTWAHKRTPPSSRPKQKFDPDWPVQIQKMQDMSSRLAS